MVLAVIKMLDMGGIGAGKSQLGKLKNLIVVRCVIEAN
jgi:hypothetical protein